MKGENFTSNSGYQKDIRTLIEKEELICLGFVELYPEPRFSEFEQWLSENAQGIPLD